MGVRTVLAILLIVVGCLGLAYGSISFTRNEKVVDLGPIEVNKESRERIPLPPIVGGVLLLSGVGLLMMRDKRA